MHNTISVTRAWLPAVALGGAFLLSLPAICAPFRPRIGTAQQTVHGRPIAAVTVNGQEAAAFRVTVGDFDPSARATVIAGRLTDLVASGLQPGDIAPHAISRRLWGVKAGDTLLLTASRPEAAAQHTSSEALARSWAAHLQRLLAEPPLTLSPASLTIPLGETRTVTVGGAVPAQDISVADTDPHATTSQFDAQKRLLTVRGVATGTTTISLQADAGDNGQASAQVAVSVMKYAAQIAPSVMVGVTGDPAPPGIVTQAAYMGLSRGVDAEDGAILRLLATPKITQPLAVGARTTVPIPMRLTGDNLLPVQGQTLVTIVNQPVPLKAPATLLYSNNPEQVKHGQSLFVGRLQPFAPARLDYHHQNSSGAALIFHAELINATDEPAAVQVIAGIALPGADTVQVGRRAGAAFLNALNGNIGMVLDVPPHARVPLVTQRFADGLTVSGLVQIQQIGGSANALTLRVAADSDAQALTSPLGHIILSALGNNVVTAPALDLPEDVGKGITAEVLSPYVFPAPLISLTAHYAVGGKWAYIRIGHHEALQDASGKIRLWGNYGVTYDIAVTVTNPTSAPRPVGLYFAPEAGLTAGVFQIDNGPVQEFDPLSPPTEALLAKITLAPGETHVTHIKTIPLNGSSYPASVIVHAP